MVDHHVDRLGVEAEQSVQPTSTNRSIDALGHSRPAARIRKTPKGGGRSLEDIFSITCNSLLIFPEGTSPQGGLAGLVAIARGKTPDPIPNSAVKTLSADGTAP